MGAPDSTAVTTALWRASHVILDDPPWILEDTLGLRLVDAPDVMRGAGLSPERRAGQEAGWLRDPRFGPLFRPWRATVAARSRCVEDLVEQQITSGMGQYVLLGAGLDTFALRRRDLANALIVYEIDEPDTQTWKRQRLDELHIDVPPHVRFVPFNFELGTVWIGDLRSIGFSTTAPAVVASTGVTQYLTTQAVEETFRVAAAMAAGTLFASTFMRPIDEVTDAAERQLREVTEAGARQRGHPWHTLMGEADARRIAERAGFTKVRIETSEDWRTRYFSNRADGLAPAQSEFMLFASR